MKKSALAAILVAITGLFVAQAAKADADIELFDENQQNLDGSIEMRRPTTEQFDPIRGQSVLDRPRPDYDPIPISFESFDIFPAINVGTYYDSNIFAQQANGPDDQVWKINPTVSALSDWGRNAVGITAFGDMDYYDHHNEQDYQGGAVQAEGRYDLGEQTWLAGTAGYQRDTEAKGSPSTPGNVLDASQYNLWTASAEAYRGVGQLKASVDYEAGYYQYSPVQLIGGGVVSQDVRDRLENKVGSEVGYDLTENFQPFVRASYDWRNYKDSGARNSDGYVVDVGTKMDWGGVTTAEAWGGYMDQDYYNFGPGSTVQAPDFGADILWNVTELTSIEGKAQRSIEETTEGSASSYLASEGSVTLSHELQRNIVLQLSVLYDAIDYQDLARHDDLYNIGAGGRYYINHNLYSDFTYGYQRLTSDAVGANYEAHTFFLRLGAQY
jgi:hypothetical protein